MLTPTERRVRYRSFSPGPLIGLLLILVSVTVVVSISILRTQPAALPKPLPADMQRLGLIAVPITAAMVPVSSDAAIATAWDEVSSIRDQNPTVDAYLVQATDPNWVEANGFKDRRTWIVKFSGIDVPLPCPPGSARCLTAHVVYVIIDADTGAGIDIQYWE